MCPTHSRYFIPSIPNLVDATNVVLFSSVPSVGRMKQEPGEPRPMAVAGETGKEHYEDPRRLLGEGGISVGQ